MSIQDAARIIADMNAGRINWDDNILAEANKTLAGTGGGGGGFPQLSFDYEAEVKASFEKLKPFYDDVLRMAKGDMNLAKRILEFTYAQGMRESEQEYQQQTREQEYQFPQERRGFMEGLNQRGMLRSQLRTTGQRPGEYELGESQALRAEAVRRALENRRERLTKAKGFGEEEETRKFQREEKGLQREQRQEATGMAMNRFGMESAKYNARLAEWQAAEQRRIAQEQINAQRELANLPPK